MPAIPLAYFCRKRHHLKKSTLFLAITLVLLAIGGGTAYFMWNKPHRNVDNEKAIVVDARQLFNEYNTNEADANKKYLNKALEVSGQVLTIDTNQDGQPYLVLQTDDLMSGIMCTMRSGDMKAGVGQSVTIKGFCSGFVGDVKLTDCIISE